MLASPKVRAASESHGWQSHGLESIRSRGQRVANGYGMMQPASDVALLTLGGARAKDACHLDGRLDAAVHTGSSRRSAG